MKRFTSLLLSILMLLSASAAVFAAAETGGALLRGDANGDGAVTAADARAILRVAASLDSADDLIFAVIDVDESGNITAKDARLTLRVAAALDVFEKGATVSSSEQTTNTNPVLPTKLPTTAEQTTGIKLPTTTPDNPHPEKTDLDIIYSGTYEMVLTYAMDGDPVKLLLAEDQGNLCLQLLEMETFEDISVLLVNDVLYAAFKMNKDSDKIALISEAGMRSLAPDAVEDLDEMKQMLDLFTSLIPKELGTPAKATENGEKCLVYTYEASGMQMLLYMTESGKLRKIVTVDENANESEILIESVSATLSAAYFDLKNDTYVSLG